MSKTQFEAIIEMSENDGLKSQFEMVKSEQVIDTHSEDLKPFILLVADKGKVYKQRKIYYKRQMLIRYWLLDIRSFQRICCMVNIYLMNPVLYYREGFITNLMPRKDKSYLVIDNFNRVDPDIFQTYINVLEGYEMTMPRYNKEGNMIKWSRQKDSYYHFNPNWHIVGITYDDLNEIKHKYTEQFLKYTRIVKVKQDD